MAKLFAFNSEARQKLLNGAKILCDAVVSTLGPRSKNVAIDSDFSTSIIHDGVTVARAIKLKDPLENMGVKLIREASSKTNDLAGDGTTTATLLAYTLLKEGSELLQNDMSKGYVGQSVNAMVIKETLVADSEKIVAELDKISRKFKKDELQHIAKISSGNDAIASLVAEAMKKAGNDGLVMVERTNSFESIVEHNQGMEFDNGYLSPYFVTDPHRMVCEYEDAYVLLTDYSIADPMLLVPIVEKVIEDGQGKKALLVIASDVIGPALQALVLTKLKSNVPLVAVVAPEYADRRRDMLEDMAILTGGVVFSVDKKDDLKEIKIADLGRVSCRITQTHTLITPKNPDKEEIDLRANAIKEQIKETTNQFARERLQERLSKLTQGVAVIKVGGDSEVEIGEKKERVIDAVNATKCAIEDGIVAGGGVALRDVADSIDISDLSKIALKAPYLRILENSGLTATDCVKGEGVNVVTGQKGNMIEMGVIDPVKVTKLAVRHAFSVAGTMLTTDTLIAEEEDTSVQKMKLVQ